MRLVVALLMLLCPFTCFAQPGPIDCGHVPWYSENFELKPLEDPRAVAIFNKVASQIPDPEFGKRTILCGFDGEKYRSEAHMMGFPGHKAFALILGWNLMRTLPDRVLEGVMAHELAHETQPEPPPSYGWDVRVWFLLEKE
ncbi:MAG TPA: hypothetical protein VG102_01290, partial [Candidatus Paceibacterota bacterium]|nr:hypothetical protein [Candidatus Paceibacterota bacterium]